MHVKKHHLFNVWAEICLVFFVLQSTAVAECDSLYVEIEGNCYWEQDIKFIKDLIANSNLSVEPLGLGTQKWSDGRLTEFKGENSSLKGELPISIGNLDSLKTLRLSSNQLTGTIPESITNLSNLTDLYLLGNQLTGSIPDSIGNLSSLKVLLLNSNQLTGTIPDSIGNLSSLRYLNLQSNRLTGSIPKTIGNLTSLEYILLGGVGYGGNDLTGSIPDEIGKLTRLKEINLSNNELTGSIPDSISNLTSLTHLGLSNNELTGTIPKSIGNLSNLNIIDLSINELTGTIPDSIGNLSSLKYLYLNSNQLSGSIPKAIDNLSNLEILRLYNNQLTGSIPDSISNLTSLTHLGLSNNELTGSIPESISNLISLTHLGLSNNKLSGKIPETICTLNLTWSNRYEGLNKADWEFSTIYNNQFCPSSDNLYPTCVANFMGGNQQGCTYEQKDKDLYLKTDLQFLKDMIANSDLSISPFDLGSQKWKDTRLVELILNNSGLKAAIPQSIGNPTQLTFLKSKQNKFTGSIPDSIKHLINLTHLEIAGAEFSDGIPVAIGDLIKLEKLFLQNNSLSDSIPLSLGNLTEIKDLRLDNNKLTGTIPESITTFSNLTRLYLSNNQFTGTIPDSIGNLSSLTHLYLYNNGLTGTIPDSIGNLSSLTHLYLYKNEFTGLIPETIGNLSNLEALKLYNNELAGSIPASIGNLSSLKQLSLHSNQLTGVIPESIGNLINLTNLVLADNKLFGEVPESIGNLTKLTYLGLYRNELDGVIPETIGNMVNLNKAYLFQNKLTGSIPTTIGNLTKLTSFSVNTNKLTGTIPATIGNLTNLDYLGLLGNQLIGTIPDEIGNLIKLRNLYLSDNELTGSIPKVIGNLTNLKSLHLHYNQLSGKIPDTIGNLSSLNYLYLNSNQLSGRIPDAIGNISSLKDLRLNNNQLRGIVPSNLCDIPNLSKIYLQDNNLCPSYPSCISSIGNQNTSKCHFPDIYVINPDGPVTEQMVTLTGLNFGSPFDSTTVKFYQDQTVLEGSIFKTPSIETELYVRIPAGLTTGICTTRVLVTADSLLTSWPLSFNIQSVPDGPNLRKVYKNLANGWTAVDTIIAQDTILVSGYGIDTYGGTVFLFKDGKAFQDTSLTTKSDPVFGIAPQIVVPTGLGTGKVEITVSTVVNGTESKLSDQLFIDYIDDYVFVNSENADGPWLGTEESPYNEIQAGINSVSNDGTVLVSNGTYKENINFVGKGIKLGSLYMTTGDKAHISSTIIDGNQNGSVVSFVTNEDTSSTLIGFTIQNGSGTLINETQTHGGGIYCNGASPTLEYLNIVNNTATNWGGGLNCSFSAQPIISHVVIRDNKTIDENDGQGGGLYTWFSSPHLINVLMVNNSATYGGGAYLGQEGSGAKFTNVTIADNKGTYGGGLYLTLKNGKATNTPKVINSIISNNKPQQVYFDDENNPWGIDISYSIIEGGKDSINNVNNDTINWGTGSIGLSPLLTIDYRLDPYSPAIGEGSSTGAPLTDLNGDPRPNPEGSSPDMGAYESMRALRLLRTNPILDGLKVNDISLWNDSLSLSAHWKKFENNSSINYEYAIGSYEVNNIVDWQSAISDTFITVTGLNLEHDSTYFFNVIGMDAKGRVSETSSSNGVLIDIISPYIVSAEENWTAINTVLGDLELNLKISEPVVAGSVSLSSSQADPYKFEYKLIDKEKYEMTVTGPFIGGDELSFTVKGLQDKAGSITSDIILTYAVGHLSDYNVDGSVDASDLSQLFSGWKNNDLEYELGPTIGNVPFLKPEVDGQFDIYDAAAFTRMWHWSLNKSEKMIPSGYVNSGDELMYMIQNSIFRIQLSKEVNAIDFYFDYPKEYLNIKSNEQISTTQEMMLSHIDTLHGKYSMVAGYLEQKMRSIEIPYIINGKDDVTITAMYRMFDPEGELISQGTKEILFKPLPEEFALHQNYPNPFNPITTIKFDVPEQTHINLIIYDVRGREVAKLLNKEMSPGYQSITWNTRNNFNIPVSAGVYFYQIQTKGFVKTRKMILLK